MLFAMLFEIARLVDRVQISAPQQRLVLNAFELQRLCAAEERVFACMLFTEETLECHCREQGGLWHMQLTAYLSPLMLLSRPADARHEWLHLHDLHSRLLRYMAEAMAVGWATAGDCERVGRAHAAGFHELMNGFRRASNAWYH